MHSFMDPNYSNHKSTSYWLLLTESTFTSIFPAHRNTLACRNMKPESEWLNMSPPSQGSVIITFFQLQISKFTTANLFLKIDIQPSNKLLRAERSSMPRTFCIRQPRREGVIFAPPWFENSLITHSHLIKNDSYSISSTLPSLPLSKPFNKSSS